MWTFFLNLLKSEKKEHNQKDLQYQKEKVFQ